MEPFYIIFILFGIAFVATLIYVIAKLKRVSNSREGNSSGNAEREIRDMCKNLSGEELYNKACEYVDKDGSKTNYSRWEALMNAAAEKDYIPAVREWGIYKTYDDNALAEQLLTRAAEAGDSAAIQELYDMYYLGISRGTPKINEDVEKAAEIITPFAEKGNAVALRLLGKYYQHDKDDDKKALELYLKAAEGGDAEAMYDAANIYYMDDEYDELKRLLLKAAEQNYAEAENMLGNLYEDPDELGEGVSDYTQAMYWYKRASEHGDRIATCNVGEMYLNGKGVVKDEYEAFRWFKKAMDEGSVNGTFLCGKCYMNGTGVEQDKENGIKLYTKAARYGCDAQYALGLCYLEGDGVEKNVEKAAYYIKKAATCDYIEHEEARAKLEELYASGVIKRDEL